MSRVGKLPVNIPDNIKVTISNNEIVFDSGKVKKNYTVSKGVKIEFAEKQLKLVADENASSKISMFIGMDRSNLKNIVQGLQTPFKTTLEINGVGFKTAVDKSILVLTLGYSHEIFYSIPKGITITPEKPNLLIVSGDDKVLVGQTVAEIIDFKGTEPYKGKGIKIFGKSIIRKEGKKK
ncbi:MAG: 50S ribosomal protein L6 [Alphaproteobacteria bacterium]